eukprot:XP_001695227.1 component of oligomeric golgi complex 2 [Chlamydomonas reinhardtii]
MTADEVTNGGASGADSAVLLGRAACPVWLNPERFLEQEFNADACVADLRRYVPLATLQNELSSYLATLKTKLVEVINEDYADYVGLSGRLANVEGAVVRMRKPLLELRDKLHAVQEAVRTELNSLNQGLRKRKEVATQRALLELILEVAHVAAKCRLLERVAAEVSRLAFLANKGKDLAFVRSLEPRIAAHRAALRGHLGEAEAAEGAVRRVVVAPLVDRLIAEHKAHGGLDLLGAAVLDEVQGALAAALPGVERLRAGPAYGALMRRWNTSVYFSLLFQEIAALVQARPVVLPPLTDRFLRLALQLAQRYATWELMAVVHDAEAAAEAVRSAGRGLAAAVGEEAVERCVVVVRQLKGITATYRMTAKAPPSRASHYVGGVLTPLRALLEAAPVRRLAPELQQALLVLPVAEGVCARYAALAEELLVSVRKTESSLKRLKKAKAGGEEDAAAAVSDSDKITLQLHLDAAELGQQLGRLLLGAPAAGGGGIGAAAANMESADVESATAAATESAAAAHTHVHQTAGGLQPLQVPGGVHPGVKQRLAQHLPGVEETKGAAAAGTGHPRL